MPGQKYKLAIFDFDGTLFATHEAIIHCIKKTFSIYEKAIPSHDVIYQTITKGIGLEDTFNFLLSTMTNGEHDEKYNVLDWVKTYRTIYKNENELLVKPFDHVKDTLEHIKQTDTEIVIISNKGIDAINSTLEKFQLKQYITLVVGDTKNIKKKPDPMIYNQLIQPKFLEIERHEILMIGDTSADLLFAHNIGAAACWAKYGYGNAEECNKLKYTYSINGLDEIKDLFKNEENPEFTARNARLSY